MSRLESTRAPMINLETPVLQVGRPVLWCFMHVGREGNPFVRGRLSVSIGFTPREVLLNERVQHLRHS